MNQKFQLELLAQIEEQMSLRNHIRRNAAFYRKQEFFEDKETGFDEILFGVYIQLQEKKEKGVKDHLEQISEYRFRQFWMTKLDTKNNPHLPSGSSLPLESLIMIADAAILVETF